MSLIIDVVCGRYASTKNPGTLAVEFDAIDQSDAEPEPNYNVAPTDVVPSLVTRHPRDADGNADPDSTQRCVRMMRWGLIPHWSKDARGGARMINARAETVRTKPAFKQAVAKRRCVLPADGWFEWRREPDTAGKQPFFMTRADGASIPMAGLWASWRDPADGSLVLSCSVLTVPSAGQLADIHDRMPLLLAPDALTGWLDPDVADIEPLDLADPALGEELELRPVAALVGNVRNNGPELLARKEEAADLDSPTLF